MTDFFLSYTQADRAWAEWIAWMLEAAGYKTKIQAWDFGAGKNFVVEMDTAAQEAERTLLVLSPDYLDSRLAKAEWATAFAKDPTGEKGTILSVRVRKVEVVGLLGPIVHVDLVDLDEAAAREKLLAGLARGRTKPVEPPARRHLAAHPLDHFAAPATLERKARLPDRSPNLQRRRHARGDRKGLEVVGGSSVTSEKAARPRCANSRCRTRSPSSAPASSMSTSRG